MSLDGLLKRGHRYVRQELLSESQAKWKKKKEKRIRQIVNERLPQRVMGDQDGHKLYKFKLLPEALVMPKAVFDSLSPSCYQFSVLPSKAVLRRVGV